MAHECWLKIPDQFPFAKLGNHIVMPNHVHGIVIIDKPDGGIGRNVVEPDQPEFGSQPHPEPPTPPGGITGNKNPMLHDNLSKIVRWYKGRTTFECRKIHADFAWQSRFHDHIIRNDQSFYRISRYIVNNPLKWGRIDFILQGNNLDYIGMPHISLPFVRKTGVIISVKLWMVKCKISMQSAKAVGKWCRVIIKSSSNNMETASCLAVTIPYGP